MWPPTSSSSTPSHSPKVGEPRRRSTTTSNTRPRATRTSFPWPGWVWKWMPRSVPWREREWLSCTKSVGMPYAVATSARNVSTKKPRSSPCTVGASRTSPSSRVSSRCIAGRRLGGGRRKIASPCRGPPPCPRPPAAIRRFPRTSPHASRSSRAPRRTSPSTSSTTSTRSPSTPPRNSPAAPTRAARTVVRFSQALGFEGFPELQEAAREEYRHHHRTAKTPEPADAAVQPRPVTVRAGRRRRSRQRRGHGAARQPLRGRRRDRGDRRRREDPDRRHGPDGVLRLLPAPPADAARRPRRDRGEPEPGGAVPARPDRRAHAGDRAVAPAARTRWCCAR